MAPARQQLFGDDEVDAANMLGGIGNKKAKAAAHKSGASTFLQESFAMFIASSMTLKEKMHKEYKERCDVYFNVQGQEVKMMQETSKVKGLKIKEMQEARKLKIMTMDTLNMTGAWQEYFTEEVARIMKERKQRAMVADTQKE